MPDKFYLTTPLYYVNDVPHIGHAYTTVAADVLARYKRMMGFDVFFLTGTDEHGQKVFRTAEEAHKNPQEFVDSIVSRFKEAWKILGISYDDFIRTSEERHEKVVQEIFSRLLKQGDIYKGEYEGWYCTPCESFWAEGQLVDDLEGRPLCPDCGREVDRLKEESYFFRLSKYQDKLLCHIEKNPTFIQPVSRKNEVVNFIKQGLHDLSVTRTAFPWGVKVKEDPEHVVYVWFDALINYISAIGYPDSKKFKKLWPADVHLMGKEIVRFHAVTWPSMLMALGVDPPRKIFGHGWWTVEGKKMSKSKGNVVDPLALSREYGVDAVRYFILREVPFGVDGDFSIEKFKSRYNADLANDLGNLLSRSLTMVEKYFKGKIPSPKDKQPDDLSKELNELVQKMPTLVSEQMDKLAYAGVLEAVWKLVSSANAYIEKEAPWKMAKTDDKDKLAAVLYNLCETLKTVAILVSPTMPATAQKVWEQLGLPKTPKMEAGPPAGRAGIKIAGIQVKKGKPLFPRLEK